MPRPLLGSTPAVLTSIRLLLGPAMVLAAWRSGDASRPWLVGCLVLGMGTDLADGTAARLLGVQSARLRRFDSRTDVVFWLCALASWWILSPREVARYWWVVAGVLSLEAMAFVIDQRRSDAFATRSYLAKAKGIVVFLGMVWLIWGGAPAPAVWVVAAWVVVADIDVMLIEYWARGVPGTITSAWHAWRVRGRAR